MISFIVPAHNEDACIVTTLEAIHASARALALDYEIVVVDDASTDGTAQLAGGLGARVISVQHRQIAATRNSGARAARGERFIFIDADTTANARAVAAALRAMDRGAAGGGASVWFDGEIPLYIRLGTVFMGPLSKLIGFTGGAFMFCTREAFAASGGFDERLFCGEEGAFALGIKQHGKFVVVWPRVHTSGRRLRTMSGLQIAALGVRVALSPKTITSRAAVQKIWYESNRQGDNVFAEHDGC